MDIVVLNKNFVIEKSSLFYGSRDRVTIDDLPDSVIPSSRSGQRLMKNMLVCHNNIALLSNPEVVDILMKYGKNPYGWSALHYALDQGDYKAAKILILSGADVDSVSGNIGRTSTLFKCFRHFYKNTESWLDLKISDPGKVVQIKEIIDLILERTHIPIDVLAGTCSLGYGWTDVFEKLIKKGMDVNGYDNLLNSAIYNNNYSALTILINYGADINKHNSLAYAIQNGSFGMVKTLLDCGADPKRHGLIPLAIRLGKKDVVQLLLERGAIIN